MSTPAPRSLSDVAAAAPVDRDRFVDFLRAASIAVVVLGHWLMAVIVWRDGQVTGRNALEVIGWGWLVTWGLQVMPLFFFVGGFSNNVAWTSIRAKGGGYAEFMRSRLVRLLRPTLVFAVVGVGVFALLRSAGLRGETFDMATQIVAKPVWFLAVYVAVIALAPAMAELHRRHGVRVLLALAAGAAMVDFVRIRYDVPHVGALNFFFVWLFPHQLGFFYADGSLTRASRRLHWVLVGGGLLALAVATGSGVYSASMVGVEEIRGASNNSPPSICLIALTMWMCGAAMLVRKRMNAKLASPSAWKAVVAANSMIMTVFLWHLAALMMMAAVAMPLGFPQPDAGSGAWWALRLPWIALALVPLVPLVAVFGKVERAGLLARRGEDRASTPALVAATVLTAGGLASMAQWGFGPSFATSAIAPLAIALALRLCRVKASDAQPVPAPA